ncbi:NAD(P)/FAD-dependent oxidoreductase [Bacillus sp. 1P06AnD]|uniref:NAD(P)/FAD-dependent oxidoreductase n=1 Tax=Bacillus sp. 1P06AnD TaxID=3132208 RepID=UPI0039A193CA
MNREIYDVTIVGGGPIGLFTAFYSGMRNLKTKIIECKDRLGGKITEFYPDKIIRDIGGIPLITGASLVEQLEEQAKTFRPEIVFNQFISGLKKMEDGIFQLESDTGELHYTRTIILTIGPGVFKPIKLDIANCEDYENHTLHYKVPELNHFHGKNVCISGGGDAAVDWANQLASYATSVMVVHRRDGFNGHESSIENMKENAKVYSSFYIKDIKGQEKKLQTAVIEHMETGELVELEVDELIVNHGIQGDLGGINEWGLLIENDKIAVNESMETNIPGIFAAGDAVTYPTKLKLIAGGFTEGPIALNSAKRYMEPGAEEMAMYSTHHEKWV